MYLRKLSTLGCCQASCGAHISYLFFGVVSRLSSRSFYTLYSFLGLTKAASQCTVLSEVAMGAALAIPMPEAVPGWGGNI